VARALVEAGVDLEARTSEGRTALHDSIEHGAVEIMQLLLDAGAEVDICSAAILGRLDRLRRLLDADPELANDRSTGLSPLGWASFGNRVDTARELIERGARMDDGELLCAASVGHVEVGRLLIEHGARPDDRFPGNGLNALHAAAAMRYTHDSRAFVRMLLDAGADVEVRSGDGRTAQEIAAALARRQRESASATDEHHRKRYAEVAALLRDHAKRC
jgi:ankyrin repeat protein